MWESAWVVNKNSQTVKQSSLRGIVRRERSSLWPGPERRGSWEELREF
jgi:hypothetical protein